MTTMKPVTDSEVRKDYVPRSDVRTVERSVKDVRKLEASSSMRLTKVSMFLKNWMSLTSGKVHQENSDCTDCKVSEIFVDDSREEQKRESGEIGREDTGCEAKGSEKVERREKGWEERGDAQKTPRGDGGKSGTGTMPGGRPRRLGISVPGGRGIVEGSGVDREGSVITKGSEYSDSGGSTKNCESIKSGRVIQVSAIKKPEGENRHLETGAFNNGIEYLLSGTVTESNRIESRIESTKCGKNSESVQEKGEISEFGENSRRDARRQRGRISQQGQNIKTGRNRKISGANNKSPLWERREVPRPPTLSGKWATGRHTPW